MKHWFKKGCLGIGTLLVAGLSTHVQASPSAFLLQASNGQTVGTGSVETMPYAKAKIDVSLGETRYEETTEVQHNTKLFSAGFYGPRTRPTASFRHLMHVHLVADNAPTLQCNIVTRYGQLSGVCHDETSNQDFTVSSKL